MALTTRAHDSLWRRSHFVLRFLGLIGFLVAMVGMALAYHAQLGSPESWRPVLAGEVGTPAQVGLILTLTGGAVAALALLVELVNFIAFTTLRRSGAGINAAVQVALVLGLLFLVNFYSFYHYLRLDWTRQQRFTLPADVQKQLRELKGETTIVVYRQHKAFGSFETKEDNYDAAAEQKVVEKIYDLVEQLREFGPQFRIAVLDARAEDYEDRLKELTGDAPDLKHEIELTKENTVFFYAKEDAARKDGKLEKLSFNALYQLDKKTSRGDDEDRRNLVLRHDNYGINAFTRRIMNIDAKKPKVALLTIHPVLSTQSDSPLGAKGLANALSENGFEVLDIIIKKLVQERGPQGMSMVNANSIALTYEESKFDKLESHLRVLKAESSRVDQELKTLPDLKTKVDDGDIDSICHALARGNPQFLLDTGVIDLQDVLTSRGLKEGPYAAILRNSKAWGPADKKTARELAQRIITEQTALSKEHADLLHDSIASTEKEMEGYDLDRYAEVKRIKDIRSKLDRLLADCDLIVLPRQTVLSVFPLQGINSSWYALDTAQTEAVKSFLLAGKPILACFGPPYQSPEFFSIPPANTELEQLLGELGVELGKQIVLHPEELAAIQEGEQESLAARSQVDIPPVDLNWPADETTGQGSKTEKRREEALNPIRESLRLTARSIDQPLDLKVPGARPIFLDPKKFGTRYQLTDESLKSLETDEVPEDIIGALKPLVGKQFDDRNGFVKELKKCLSAEQLVDYQSQLLSRARSYRSSFDPEIMRSSAASWNQDVLDWSSQNPPLQPDASAPHGTIDQKGKGPFALAVALETTLPASWGKASGGAGSERTRIVVLGNGGLFTGEKLSASREKLLVDCCNWLVGRDDLLAKDTGAQGLWRYPRVTRYDQRELQLWHLGTQCGLPLLFAVLGCAVVLVRKLR